MMFICRACKGQQTRGFATLRALFAPAAPQTTVQTTSKVPPSTRSPPAFRAKSVSAEVKGHRTAQGLINRAPNTSRSTKPKATGRGAPHRQGRDVESSEQRELRVDMERQMGRPWREGDVYSPHDLSSAEMAKWKRAMPLGKQSRDICDTLGINPLHHYKNFSMMSEYMTETGRIKSGRENGLRPINQRKMAKAIRRAVSCGLMPSVHRHPEILRATYEPESGKRPFRRV